MNTLPPALVEEMQREMLRYFKYDHLPEHLQSVSRRFAEFADDVLAGIHPVPESLVFLRKLLEAKDAAVRSAVPR